MEIKAKYKYNKFCVGVSSHMVSNKLLRVVKEVVKQKESMIKVFLDKCRGLKLKKI